MLGVLLGLALILGAADHWTTWLCLTGGFGDTTIVEGNPLAAWLFGQTGLIQGLVLDSLLTFAALLFLASTRRFSPRLKNALLATVALATSYAVTNNLFAIAALGIGPFGAA